MATDMLQTQLDNLAKGKKYLGDPTVVREEVRLFVNEVISLSKDDLEDGLEQATDHWASVFLGEQPDYTATNWNTGGGFDGNPPIVDHLLQQIEGLSKHGKTPTEIVSAAFGVLAVRIMKDAVDVPEEQLESHINQLIDNFANLLLGFPQAGETEDEYTVAVSTGENYKG